MTYDEWMRYGIEAGWCGPPVCYTHDGLPCTADEDDMLINGDDPCVHIVRMYEDQNTRLGVEFNHTPTTWRNSYR